MTQGILVFISLQIVLMMSIAFYFNNAISKFLVVFLLVLFANGIYFLFDGIKGWPTEDTSNVKGTLSSVTIINPSETDKGAIFITVFLETPPGWYEYHYHRNSPRLFYVKYSNDRAAKFEEAKEALEEGKEVKINGIPAETSSEGTDALDDSIAGLVNQILDKIMSSQKDTYKPETSDIEIQEQEVPPTKGSK